MIKEADEDSEIALKENHAKIAQTVDRFDKALRHLRFEGKLHVGNNYSEICRLTKILKKEISQYFKVEEEAIFPFLRKYLPKLSPVTSLLTAEQEGLMGYFESFEASLLQVKKSNNQPVDLKLIERLWGRGIYLIHFLKNHLLAENMVLFKKIKNELKNDEMAQLNRLIERADHHEKRGNSGAR